MRAVDVKSIPDERPGQAAGRMLSAGEIQALLQTCAADSTPAGVRDAAILGLAAFAGLRRQEIASLHLHNWHQESQVLQVLGKRNKIRSVPLNDGLGAALHDWRHLRGIAPGPLFVAINKGGRLLDQPLGGQAVYEIAEKRRQEAGISPFAPHDLRRTFISELLDAGADLVTVQKLVGHSDANTTAGYDRRDERAKQAAVGRLHMAWRRRY